MFSLNQLSITRSWTPVRCSAPPGSEQVGSSSSAPAAAWFLAFPSLQVCVCACVCVSVRSAAGCAGPEGGREDLPSQHGAANGHAARRGDGIGQTCKESDVHWQQQCSGTDISSWWVDIGYVDCVKAVATLHTSVVTCDYLTFCRAQSDLWPLTSTMHLTCTYYFLFFVSILYQP